VPGCVGNSLLRVGQLRELTLATDTARGVLAGYLDMNRFSARAHDRVLKLARTIADLQGSEQVREEHVKDASQLRCLDKPLTGRPGRGVNPLQIARHAALHKSPGASPGEERGEIP
jgi:hypothetical protein